MATDDRFRIEHDTMGEVKVPVDALWRAQTQRAVENFPISGRGLERAQIRALGLVKAAAARVNKQIGVLPAELADAIAAAADEVAAGKHDEHFPVDVFQTGSGTSSNMNANEVIASIAARAGVDVHPNDHVNASQSSNDVFPTTIHVAATEALRSDVVPALEHLAAALRRRSEDWADVVKAGRTHLMDAVPITLGQEAGRLGHADGVRRRPGSRRAAPAGPAADRRHRCGHRAERAGGVRRRGWSRSCAASHRLARRSPRPRTTSRPRARATGWWRPPARCAPWPSPCSRWPTTSAGWAPDRAPASPSCACRTCSRAARSCRARSTR